MQTLVIISLSLILTALLGGGVFQYTIAVLAALFSVLCLLFPGNQQDSKMLPILSCLLILIITATFIPLPSGLAANFGSKRTHQNLLAEKALQKASELTITKPGSPFFSITRNRAGTGRMILLLIAGFSIATLTSRLPLNRKEQYLRFLLLFATSIAIAGIISQWVIPQGKNIWWLFPVPHGRPVGCFINRNHFGGFAALLGAPAIFLTAESIEKKRYTAAILWGLCFITLSLAAIMSLSKGAWLALAAAVIFSAGALLCRRQWFPAIFLSASMSVVISTLFLVPNQQLNERFKSLAGIMQNQSAEMRLTTWRDSLAILKDYPVTGTGANAFRMVFPQYRGASTRKPFEHAENEYVQIPVEFGIPASALIIAIIACFLAKWRSTLLTEKSVTMSLCIAGTLVAVSVHAMTDFALRIPLYFLTVCSMLGLVMSSMPSQPSQRSARTGLATLLPVGALILIALASLSGNRIYKLDSIDYLETAGSEDICRAITWSPTSWQAWYNLGRTAVSLKTDEACHFGESCLTQATKYDPLNYLVWEQLARLRLSMQDLDGAMKANCRLKELRPWKKITEIETLQPEKSN